MNIDAINEAAEKYAKQNEGNNVTQMRCFKAGALSDAAKQYWCEQFSELEQLLIDLEEYFEDRANARFEGEVYVANEAMRLLNKIQEIQQLYAGKKD